MHNKMKIWIDDVRTPPEDVWQWAKTYSDGIALIDYAVLHGLQIDTISFDHDLGEEKTGYDIALYLAEKVWWERIPKPKHAFVHSANPPGRDNIQSVINRYLSASSRVWREEGFNTLIPFQGKAN